MERFSLHCLTFGQEKCKIDYGWNKKYVVKVVCMHLNTILIC